MKNGNILASDYAGGIKIYNDKLNLFQPYYLKTNYSLNQIQVVLEDASGNIWFGGLNGGTSKIIKYSPSYYTAEDFDVSSFFKNYPIYDDVTGIVQDDDGYLWVSFYWQGVYRFDPKSRNMQKFNSGFNDSDISTRKVTQTIYKDKYGVIWIGAWGGGLTKFDPLREPFNYSKINSEEVAGSGAGSVNVIAGSQQHNKITIGTSATGLFSYNLENKKSVSLKTKFDPTTLPDGIINIQSLAVDNEGNK